MYRYFLYVYFSWLALQNFLLPWSYRQGWLPVVWLTLVMASKEAVLVAAIVLLSFRIRRRNLQWLAPDCFAVGHVALLTFYLLAPGLFHSNAPFALRMISLRSVISLALFYFWGRLSFLSIRHLRGFLRFLVGLQVAVAAFGLYEWLALPDAFWSDTIGIGTFMLDVKGLLDGQNVINGLPSNMFRLGARRVISSYGDPLAMGIASVFPLLLCLAWLLRNSKSRHRWIWRSSTIVVGIALLLTLGRESIGAAVISSVLLLWWAGKFRGYVSALAIIALLLLMLPQIWNFGEQTLSFREESSATHLTFLAEGWRQIPKMLLGNGLGEAGGWAYSLAGVRTDTGESSYFDLMAQTGLASVILLLGFLISTARQAFRESKSFFDPLIAAALTATTAHVIGRSLMAVFSPSLFGVVPLASFFFFCGVAFTTLQRSRLRPAIPARRALVLWKPAAAIPCSATPPSANSFRP
ncbi:MAG TPA: hypothetical protein VH088_13685 [Terriglobales bacterium]|nr:hypothetical protein [Terriglobales bacterium]